MPTQTTLPSLSILIPTYNQVCVELAKSLQMQASRIPGLTYELLVGDDGSTDPSVVSANEAINALPHSRYIVKENNEGRAAIRNYLARTARYELLLYADSHMSVIREDFIARYLQHSKQPLVYGGYTITDRGHHHHDNLRYAYEMSCIDSQRAERRAASPYANFHTSNFMVRREVMLTHPLDERFKRYGYEDVLFGKTLKEANIDIVHIDNPLGFNHFESNKRFMEKTDEGLQTLSDFCEELRGYSRLLALSDRLCHWHLAWLPSLLFRVFGTALLHHLKGPHPTLTAFKIYRLGKFCQMRSVVKN